MADNTDRHSNGPSSSADVTAESGSEPPPSPARSGTTAASSSSVFGDFQRMWMQRFPQSSLSDAWELDVRASLARHRQRIGELRTELEQETLYVEYLEQLLGDVERRREQPPPASAAQDGDSMTTTTEAMTAKTTTTTTKTSSSSSSSSTSSSSSSSKSTSASSSAATTTAPHKDEPTKAAADSAARHHNGSVPPEAERNPALQQCITELSSNLRKSDTVHERGRSTFGTATTSSSSNSTASHFVTVIEVKEHTTTTTSQAAAVVAPTTPVLSTTTTADGQLTDKFVSEPLAAVLDAKRKIPPRPPPKNIRRPAPVEPPTVPTSSHLSATADASDVTAAAMGTPTKVAAQSQSLDRNLKPSEILRQKSSDSLDVKLGGGGGGTAGLSASVYHHRSTNPDASRQFDGLLADELGRKLVGKAESFERQRRPDAFKRTHSPTEFSASPTGSLHKSTASTHSPNGSLGKVAGRLTGDASIGSRESLGSTQTAPISERIKSYESISSISSDSARPTTAAGAAGAGSTTATTSSASGGGGGHHHSYADHEPFYDTVPLDNGDGEYVYIQAGGTSTATHSSTASSRDDISNAGSTLPMSAAAGGAVARQHGRATYSSQTSILTEPESPGRSSNYVNIDFFLAEARSSSMDSDGESDVPPLMRTISHTEGGGAAAALTPSMRRRKLSGEGSGSGGGGGSPSTGRSASIRHICASIIGSETLYVDCLNTMMQYMKAIWATQDTSQPVISKDEFETIFYKIDKLFELHTTFLRQMRSQVARTAPDGDVLVGETFRELAEHISVYGAFLHNYGRAIETVKKCGAHNQQFKEIVSRIVLNSKNEQSLSLEDLLHKPVARVQKNALVLQDLVSQTPATHADYGPLRAAQKMIQNFLCELNVVPKKSMNPSDDKALRRLVKNSFIVELADNHRKLRHLFLFNDVIACAKYKPSGRDRFEYELKWFIPLHDICILENSAFDPKEHSPVNILQLKSQACTVRDQLLLETRGDASGFGGGGGGDDAPERKPNRSAGEKHRKKLNDLEAQLVLASPNLVLRISNRTNNKTAVFFLSSDYERTLWIDSVMRLQSSSILPGTAPPIHIYDLQAWIGACQTLIKSEMGSYLLRSVRDESLLVGDLQLTVLGLAGAEQTADMYVCIEVDSYGHYFRKARTKLVCRSATPQWNESFVLELEGSQNVRVLLYEDQAGASVLRGKYVIRLSRQWLGEQQGEVGKTLRLTEAGLQLAVTMRFVPGQVSLRRVPTSKAGALFGAKMQQVLKREKRPFPFILSACIREVERRGMGEVGIYRVSGSASDLARLKKSFETNNYEAEQLLKEVDIHSVTGILKSYLRELPEALFTDALYPKLFEVFNGTNNDGERADALAHIFAELPDANRASIDHILAHLIRVHQQEAENKMSLHNLAMVFGPTLLRPGPNVAKHKDLLESSTVDVMAQAGILYCFLQARNK